MNIKRNVLLNPGPATTTDTVKLAQVVPDICPRECDFGQIMLYISNKLASFVGDCDKYTTVLFGGSGTAAVEAMLSSVVGDGRILIINNGSYGLRMCQIAKSYSLDYYEYASSPVEGLDLNSLEQTIKAAGKKFTHMAVVHHETSTGLLVDIGKIGALAKKYSIVLLTDAMSSYAAVPIDMEKDNISYLASSSNKNIQGMAGVSFVIAKKSDLEGLENIKASNFYLNLYAQYAFFKKENQTRFTPPVQTLYALKQAIDETIAEGIKNRYARYCRSWETLTAELDKLGLSRLVADKDHGRLITAVLEPDHPNYSLDGMHDYLYERGYTIYPGKIGSYKTFRIANIGAIDYKDILNAVALIKEYFINEGIL